MVIHGAPRQLCLGLVAVGVTLPWCLAACVGDDPVSSRASSGDSPASSSGVTGSASSGNAADAAPANGDLGAFLTAKKYGTDFLTGVQGDTWVASNALCVSAATEAQLPRASSYLALVFSKDETQEAGRLRGLASSAVGHRWCAIDPAARIPNCALAGALIFDGSPAFDRGPSGPLVEDEHGYAVYIDAQRVFSGLTVEAGQSLVTGSFTTCTGWTKSEGVPGHDDAGANGAGRAGTAWIAPFTGAPQQAAWLGSAPAVTCTTDERFPLLCLEQP